MIGIIAVLAAIMAPVLISAQKSAKKASCQSNLRQISRAFDAYLGDHDSCYPCIKNRPQAQYLWSGYYWRECMRRYVGIVQASGSGGDRNMILSCPCDPTPPGIYSGTSYAYSASFYMTPDQIDSISSGDHLRTKFAATNPILPCSVIQTSDVKHFSKKILVAEYWTLHSTRLKVGWYDDPESGNDPWSGERNCLFADGHVKFVPTSQIHPARSPIVNRARILPDINLTTNGIAGKDID